MLCPCLINERYTKQISYLQRLNHSSYRIKKGFVPNMKVEGILYVNKRLEKMLFDELRKFHNPTSPGNFTPALKQLADVATLPGIVGNCIGLPDVHSGYGFAVGSVAAFDADDPKSVVCPGGVGFDINCGIRLLRTNVFERDVECVRDQLLRKMFKCIPAGLGSTGNVRLDMKQLDEVLDLGIDWCLREGYSWPEDKEHCEDYGRMYDANSSKVSLKAKKRGLQQVGTLGSGNHYAEIQIVDRIYDENSALQMGIESKGQVCVMIHTGSRGLGHQIATDAFSYIDKVKQWDDIQVTGGRQLSCARISSPEGRDYIQSMSAAANFAWVSRSIMSYFARRIFANTFLCSPDDLDMHVVYDVSHNIAKYEHHRVNGRDKKLLVHRKGSTRALPPHHPLIPVDYQFTGQPVLIGGTMGTHSYVLTGTETAMAKTFGSTCHGAGRSISRVEAKNYVNEAKVLSKLSEAGVTVRTASRQVLTEEAPDCYKNVRDVVGVCEAVGISKKCFRLKPFAVIKG